MNRKTANNALRLVILLGLVSLFSDMTYEAARSINGPFLKFLGANARVVGITAGLGELFGYGLRFLSGYLADRTKKYWTIMIAGYLLNLFSVPLLALAGYWQVAVLLMIGERIGKALRTPSRDALLSFGTKEMGRGWGYGLHEAMDQIGAVAGPLLVSSVLFFRNQNYSMAYAVLTIPALIATGMLLFSRYLYPRPGDLEIKNTQISTEGFGKRYSVYLLAVILIAAGYADFPLIAFHFKSVSLMSDSAIPVVYAVAMAADALSALIFGRLYDRLGIRVILAAVLLSLLFAPMVFTGGLGFAIGGMILWGIGMGAQESVLKAEIATRVPKEKRGTAFGTFNAAYGIFWFAGSALMGILYDISITGLIVFSVLTQLAAASVLFYIINRDKKER